MPHRKWTAAEKKRIGDAVRAAHAKKKKRKVVIRKPSVKKDDVLATATVSDLIEALRNQLQSRIDDGETAQEALDALESL